MGSRRGGKAYGSRGRSIEILQDTKLTLKLQEQRWQDFVESKRRERQRRWSGERDLFSEMRKKKGKLNLRRRKCEVWQGMPSNLSSFTP
jgi:hypothetical protein